MTRGYELSWHVQGVRHLLGASVEFRFYSSEPLVPVAPDHPWLTYLAAEPVPSLTLSPDNGVIIVAVCKARTDGL